MVSVFLMARLVTKPLTVQISQMKNIVVLYIEIKEWEQVYDGKIMPRGKVLDW